MMPFVCVFWGQRQASSTSAVALSRGDDALRADLSPKAVQNKGGPLPMSSDGPGGNLWQMLSEASLELTASIRPVELFLSLFLPQGCCSWGCPAAEPRACRG